MCKRLSNIKVLLFPGIFVTLIISSCQQSRLSTAKSLLESGDFLASRKIYAAIVDAHPEDFTAHYGLGMTWCAEAIYKTELGLAAPDDWYMAIYEMTVTLHLEDDAKIRRTLAILHFNLGASYKKLGDRENAILRIQQAVSYDSTLLKAYNLLGALYQEQQDFDKAERCYRSILVLKPDYAMALFNLGSLAWAQEDYVAAGSFFQKAVSAEPDNGYFQSWLLKAQSHRKTD